MKTRSALLSTLPLVLLLACNGGSDNPPAPPLLNATKLTYTEPSTSGWRFVKVSGTGSNSDPMVFELRGPSGTAAKGAAFYVDLGSSTKVAWHALAGSTFAQAAPGFDLGNTPQLLKDKVLGGELQAGAFKKAGSADPNGGVIRIALKLASDAQWPGDVPVTVKNVVVLDGTGTTSTPTFTFGALKAE